MSDWIDSLFHLDRNRRFGVYAAAFALVAAAYWYVFYSGTAQVIREKSERHESMRLDHERKLQQVARLEEYRREVRELDARLNRAVAQLPDQKEIPDLLSTVSSVGRDSGLDIVLFRQRPEVFHDFYAEVPVEMMMRGNYRQVNAFLESSARLDRIVNLTNITLKNPVITDDDVALDTNCTAVTFRFLTEEERARIAAEKEREQRRR